MKTALVGYTGFVGSNLMNQFDFTNYYNSKNIEEAYNSNPDLLVYAGVTGTKFIANKFPDKDKKIIQDAIRNIEKINAKHTTLISTVDIYDDLNGKDESYSCSISRFGAYGNNRLYLENWFKQRPEKGNIIRLPAIYGKNLKKNFVFDIIYGIPPVINRTVFEEISIDNSNVKHFYSEDAYGLFRFDNSTNEDISELIKYFKTSKYNSIYFTDSRSNYQYYNLSRLWNDIKLILKNDIDVINLVTEPISSDELYKKIFKEVFINKTSDNYLDYNINTQYSEIFGKSKNFNYIESKEEQLEDIYKFIWKEIKLYN